MKKEVSGKKGKAGRVLAIAGIVLAALVLVYTAVCLFAGPLVYPDFYGKAERGAKIPDLWNDFVPQGVTAFEGSDETLVCGYMPGGQNSRIYRIAPDGRVTKILLENEDGTPYTGHAGGFTAAGKYIYISNAQKIFVLDAAAVTEAADGDTVRFAGRFSVPCRASFCSSDGRMLYVGEYHADGYETDESHIRTTADGTFEAMVFAYGLSEDGPFGIGDTESPEKAYAVCDEVQGFAVLPDGTAVLSCSAGLNASMLRMYRTDGEADSSFSVDSGEVPVVYLDASRETRTVKAPHMSEDLEYRNGKLHIGFEAGAKKYGGGLLPFSVTNVMKMDVE